MLKQRRRRKALGKKRYEDGANAGQDEKVFICSIAVTMADIRPEVLNMQLLAYRELIRANRIEEAHRVRDRLLERHPGYEPLVPTPEDAMKEEETTENTE